jgi:hypothetical protein
MNRRGSRSGIPKLLPSSSTLLQRFLSPNQTSNDAAPPYPAVMEPLILRVLRATIWGWMGPERVVREIEREESGGIEETGRDVLRISRAKIAAWLAGACSSGGLVELDLLSIALPCTVPSDLSAYEFDAYALAAGSP